MNQVPLVTLNNGTRMPQLGFGLWRVPDSEAEAAVATSVEAGYRSIGTAAVCANEKGAGRAIAASGLPREELFVTTKLWNDRDATWSRGDVLRAFDGSLDRLGLDRVDLYMIHGPRPVCGVYPAICGPSRRSPRAAGPRPSASRTSALPSSRGCPVMPSASRSLSP